MSRLAARNIMSTDRLQDAGGRVRSWADDTLSRNPLVVGALGLAIGAVIAAALPATRPEKELLGPAADNIKGKAQGMAVAGVETAKDLAKDIYNDAAQAAQEQGLSVEHSTEAAEQIAGKIKTVAANALESQNPDGDDASSSTFSPASEGGDNMSETRYGDSPGFQGQPTTDAAGGSASVRQQAGELAEGLKNQAAGVAQDLTRASQKSRRHSLPKRLRKRLLALVTSSGMLPRIRRMLAQTSLADLQARCAARLASLTIRFHLLGIIFGARQSKSMVLPMLCDSAIWVNSSTACKILRVGSRQLSWA